jgi:kelch-like protein 10
MLICLLTGIFFVIFLDYLAHMKTMNTFIFILGDEGDGKDIYLKCVERYDWRRSQWFTMAPMHEKRASFGCAALGEFIYVIGGYDGKFRLNTVER